MALTFSRSGRHIAVRVNTHRAAVNKVTKLFNAKGEAMGNDVEVTIAINRNTDGTFTAHTTGGDAGVGTNQDPYTAAIKALVDKAVKDAYDPVKFRLNLAIVLAKDL